MSVDAEEFLIPSFLNLNLKFFSADKQIRKFRRNKIPLVGSILPIGIEPVFASGAAPIFPLRIGKFEAEKLLRGTRLATNILGSTVVGAGARILQSRAGGIINKFLGEYNKSMREYENNADKIYYSTACFATRIAYGSAMPFKDRIKLFLAWGTRCGWFSQFYGALGNSIPIVLTDLPKSTSPHAKQYLYEEFQQLLHQLESLTGNKITDEALREKVILSNEIKDKYREILHYLKTPEKMPLSPYAYMQLLALLNISVVDYMSAIKYFTKNITKLVKTLNNRPRVDYSGIPKILLVPVFSGSEPDLPQIINELGGCLIQADYLAYGMLDPITTQGDMVQNYCDYLLKSHDSWKDNKTIVKSWLQTATDLKVDGIIFNKLVGCTSINPAYRIFKDRIQDTDFPAIDIEFNRIGENLAQLKNKCGSFIEMIKRS